MQIIKNLTYKEKILLSDDLQFQTYRQGLFLSKHTCPDDINDRYYLYVKLLEDDNNLVNQGYLYFYIDFDELQSDLIGVGIEPKYRNCGLASLLISSWVQLCLEQGINNLQTIPKQRKPFLLYLLKKYTFELQNTKNYETSPKTVYICKGNNINDKLIMFKDEREKKLFRNSNIMKTDNYRIIEALTDEIQIVDKVVLYSPYFLQDNEFAYQKSLSIYNKHKI